MPAAKRKPGKPHKRTYRSPVRDKAAAETRQSILGAARRLFASQGYAGTTLEAIAEDARVSPKTLTAVFGSKRAILGAVVNPAAFPPEVQKLQEQSVTIADPMKRLRLVVQIARQAYGQLTTELELLRTASGVAPELAELAAEIALRRRGLQGRLAAYLSERRMLRRDLSVEEAMDVLWTLGSFDVYRLLVIERHWAPERYEAWLTQSLSGQLFGSVGAVQFKPAGRRKGTTAK